MKSTTNNTFTLPCLTSTIELTTLVVWWCFLIQLVSLHSLLSRVVLCKHWCCYDNLWITVKDNLGSTSHGARCHSEWMSFFVHAMYFSNSCSIIFWIPDNTLLKRLWLLSCPHSTCTFTIVRKHKLVRKLKTLPGREILLYGIGFGKKKEQSERERECCWPDDGSQCKSQLALDSSWASAAGQPHFFLFIFYPSGWHLLLTLHVDICKCRDFEPMVLKEYFD